MKLKTMCVGAVAAAALLVPAGDATAAEKTKTVVVDDGVAPDGSRYEHIVYGRVGADGGKQVCRRFRWADARGSQGAACAKPGASVPDANTANGPLFQSPDGLLHGLAAGNAARVEVSYMGADGVERPLQVDFAHVEGDRLSGVAAKRGKAKKRSRGASVRYGDYGVYTAFLPSGTQLGAAPAPVACDGWLGSIKVVAYDEAGLEIRHPACP